MKAVDSLPHAIEAIAQYDSTIEIRLGKVRVDLESPVVARQGLFKAAEFQASEATAVHCGRKIGVDRQSPVAGPCCLLVAAELVQRTGNVRECLDILRPKRNRLPKARQGLLVLLEGEESVAPPQQGLRVIGAQLEGPVISRDPFSAFLNVNQSIGFIDHGLDKVRFDGERLIKTSERLAVAL